LRTVGCRLTKTREEPRPRLLPYNRPAADDVHIVVHITDWVSKCRWHSLDGFGSLRRQSDPAQFFCIPTVAPNPWIVNQ